MLQGKQPGASPAEGLGCHQAQLMWQPNTAGCASPLPQHTGSHAC